MKKYFIETNGYNCVAVVIDNRGIVFEFDENMTKETAIHQDFSGIEDAENFEILKIDYPDNAIINDWHKYVDDSDSDPEIQIYDFDDII